MQVPGLHEDALVLLVEPFEEEQVFETGRFMQNGETRHAAALSGSASGKAGNSIGTGHKASVTVLHQLKSSESLGIGFRTRVVEVHSAPGNVLEKVAFEFNAHRGGALCEMKETGDESRDLVGEVAT